MIAVRTDKAYYENEACKAEAKRFLAKVWRWVVRVIMTPKRPPKSPPIIAQTPPTIKPVSVKRSFPIWSNLLGIFCFFTVGIGWLGWSTEKKYQADERR